MRAGRRGRKRGRSSPARAGLYHSPVLPARSAPRQIRHVRAGERRTPARRAIQQAFAPRRYPAAPVHDAWTGLPSGLEDGGPWPAGAFGGRDLRRQRRLLAAPGPRGRSTLAPLIVVLAGFPARSRAGMGGLLSGRIESRTMTFPLAASGAAGWPMTVVRTDRHLARKVSSPSQSRPCSLGRSSISCFTFKPEQSAACVEAAGRVRPWRRAPRTRACIRRAITASWRPRHL